MEILVPGEIKTNGSGNYYGYQLLKALRLQPEITEVQHGVHWFYEKGISYDIILFQWVEMLFQWNEPTENEFQLLKEYLNYWKKRAKIVVTLHDEYPHFRDTEPFRKLYELVFSFADGFIHLGEASKVIMRKRYKKCLDNADEIVIPHGNYEGIPHLTDQKEARERLGYSQKDKILLSFGQIRSSKELRLLTSSFRKARHCNKQIKLLIAGRLNFMKSRRNIKYFTNRVPLWIDPNINLIEKFIKFEDVQYHVCAADALIIPRFNALNSGNVYLGFTFGKVVTGPDYGVTGEMLRKTGNPVFDPYNSEDVMKSIMQAFKLSQEDYGKQNMEFSKEKLNWQNIGKRYVKFFNNLRN